MTDYISLADTNKLIRKALKESFPGIKFSVRGKSYAGGASTRIYWIDGPTADQVEHLISAFEGSYFDGMIDYKGSRYAWLDGREVSFMADFLFCERSHSDSLKLRMVKRLIGKYVDQCDYLKNGPDQVIEDWQQGRLYNVFPRGGDWSMENSLQSELGKACAKHTFSPFPEHSATLDRVAFKGSDGYGAGQPDRDGNGNGYGGYPSCNGAPL